MPLLRSLPENATLLDLRDMYADLLEKLRPYGHRLMRGRSSLTAHERELIAAYVSGINNCRYSFGTHSRVAQAFGTDERVLGGLLDDIDTAPVEPRLKPLLRYVRKLTQTPSRMTRDDAEAVYDAGWSDEALLHAVAVCAYFNNMNRLVEGCGIVGAAAGYDLAARRLFEHGYRRRTSARPRGRARTTRAVSAGRNNGKNRIVPR